MESVQGDAVPRSYGPVEVVSMKGDDMPWRADRRLLCDHTKVGVVERVALAFQCLNGKNLYDMLSCKEEAIHGDIRNGIRR